MSALHRCLPALALIVSPAIFAGDDYVGVLRPTATRSAIAIPEPGFYLPMAGTFGGWLGADAAPDAFKLKLGYRYSKFFALETGFADFGSVSVRAPFGGMPVRGREFSMQTVGTIPLWTRAALYGRFGAWRSEPGASLLTAGEGNYRAGGGLRYGLGLKFDLTRRVGLQAEMEHLSPLDRWGARESDSDQITLGVTWRF